MRTVSQLACEPRAPAARSPELLFAQSESSVGRFLRQLLADRALADDLLQEVYLVAVRRREALAAADDPGAWLLGVARNLALDAMRRQGRARRAFERLCRLRPAAPADGPER